MEKINNKLDKPNNVYGVEIPPRVNDLVEAITGEKHQVLNDEQREMMHLLSEEYKKKGRNLLVEIKKWREENPSATFAEAVVTLYKTEEGK